MAKKFRKKKIQPTYENYIIKKECITKCNKAAFLAYQSAKDS